NAEGESAHERSPEIADTPEYYDHKRVDDVALTEVGADVVDLRERNSSKPGNAGAQPERERIYAPCANAHGCSHGAVLRHRAHLEPEAAPSQQGEQPRENEERENNDAEPIIRDSELADLEGAAHPRGRGHVLVGRPKHGAHRLLQNERESPSGEKCLQRPSI